MAGNISVDISSSSILSQYEFDKKVSDYYRDNIKTSTKNYLEGYEIVDSWETRERYWVYYRLSKSEYERVKQERIQSALSKSESEYRQSVQSMQSGNYAEAIKSNVKAIEMIRDVIGENLHSEITGTIQSYPGKLLSDLTSAFQGIRIIYPENQIVVSSGQKISNDLIEATIQNEMKTTLTNIPVIVTYSYAPGKKSELVSDARGMIRIKPGTISSIKKTEYVTAFVNAEKIIREATADPFVRKLLSGVKLSEFVLPVNITPSVFHVSVSGNSPGQENYLPRLKQEITSILVRDGYAIVSDQAQAGFLLSVESGTARTAERTGKVAVSLNAEITVRDKTGNSLFNQQISDVSGLGNSQDEATGDAYTTLINKLKISILPSMYKQAFRD
jgi:hypothetical protein